MSDTSIKTIRRPRLSVKIQTIAAISATAAAVVVPQIFHALGYIAGTGTALGETFLPMHLPIILVGLLAGPYAGAIAGLLGPALSFAITGMPVAAMLPFMMAELCAYGLAAGLLRNAKLPTVVKVLAVQAAGRAVKVLAILAAGALGSTAVGAASVWNAVLTGIFGIVLQLAFIPLIIYRVENMKSNED